MKTIDDMYVELRQWGLWQRTIHRNGLGYTLTQFDANIVHSTGDIKPVYRDSKSERLDKLMGEYLSRQYIYILELSFVDKKSSLEASIKLNICKTKYKAQRREAMSILIGVNAVIFSTNRLDRAPTYC